MEPTPPPEEIIDFLSVEGFIFIAGLLLIGLSAMVSRDDQTNVSAYVFTSKYGRSKLASVKVIVASLYAIVVTLFITMIGWVTEYTTLGYWDKGLEGWEVPFQFYFKFINSPYTFTFLEYHVLQIGFILVAAIAFSLLFLLISSFTRSTFISFLAGGMIFGIPLVFVEILNAPDTMPKWMENVFPYTLTYILKVDPLFEDFLIYDVGGLAVTGVALAFLIVGLCWIIFTILFKFVMTKRGVSA